jgi:hypothetical protein
MNISGLGSNTLPVPAFLSTPGVNPASGSGRDVDGDGDGGRVEGGHRGHHAGNLRQVILQALQSLGAAASSADASSATSGSASTTSADGSAAAANTAGSLKQDLHQFMHALFQAVRSESAPASSAATSPVTGASSASRADFSTRLAALISQTSKGSAPSDLQSAFDKLAADLQPPAAAGTSAPSLTLQKLLMTLQQGLGYGASNTANTGSVGNIVSQSV